MSWDFSQASDRAVLSPAAVPWERKPASASATCDRIETGSGFGFVGEFIFCSTIRDKTIEYNYKLAEKLESNFCLKLCQLCFVMVLNQYSSSGAYRGPNRVTRARVY